MKFALSIKLQLLFNFIINIMLKLVIYINGLLLAYKQWGRSTGATLNFSIPFQKFYCITTAQESWGSATFENTSWIVRTNSSIKWPTYMGTAINYIALGM